MEKETEMGSSKSHEKSNDFHSPESSHHDLEKLSQELAGNSTSNRDISVGQNVDRSSMISGDGNTVINNFFGVSGSTQTSQPIQQLSEQYLARIDIDARIIQKINANLDAVESIVKAGVLPEQKQTDFVQLVQIIQDMDLHSLKVKLDQIASISQSLLKDARKILEDKLAPEQRKLLDANSEQCISDQLQIVKQLQISLEEGSELAVWLNDSKKRLAKSFGKEALTYFPEYNKVSEERTQRFYFSLSQFLERIAHCLRWGRSNVLNSTDIPLEVSYSVYIKALELIQNKLPPHASEKAVSQFQEYVGYLIEVLSAYE